MVLPSISAEFQRAAVQIRIQISGPVQTGLRSTVEPLNNRHIRAVMASLQVTVVPRDAQYTCPAYTCSGGNGTYCIGEGELHTFTILKTHVWAD